MTLHVYSGPSLSGTDALEHRDVCPHPPIAHGDLYRLRLRPGDAVLIVDGVYQHSAPVRHKEILSLCAEGFGVYGAASIGALRAAELHEHGMAGLGTVFRWYVDGRLESDADVALMHGEADIGFRAFTHALVSVLGAVDCLIESGRIDRDTGERVVDLARSVHFSVRGDAALRAAARERGMVEATDVVLRVLRSPSGDVKQQDATAAVRDLLARQGAQSPEPPSVPDTSYRREWRLLHTPAGPSGDSPTRRQVLAYAQLFRPDFPDRHTADVLRDLKETGEQPSLWLRWLTPDELVRRGLLSVNEVTSLDPQSLMTRVLVRTFRLRPGRLAFDGLPPSLVAELPELARQCRRLLRLSEQVALTNPMFHPADVPPDLLDATFQALWQADDLGVGLLDRGLRDLEDFRFHARPFFVAARAALAMSEGDRRREASHA